jgi:hypothetical protein
MRSSNIETGRVILGLTLGRSYVQTAAGRLLINMPPTAESLRIVL